ncbi:cyanophycin synthetase [Alkaliphilus peptidifermentans]|uniref:Cyanophycin synthetase n=1 Tax=Alkaliphilus peptidifermentans DSM 18978 TaxID=1120976 RepID=A0A1G5HPU1_9FIRM|nr:cyanophycin synthetase [Alkaliphilus peptidifermentans]SCY65895.1 cyanophycin synthetase [Alkaliphilus peptidifermentans DSM 18978]
MKLINIRVYNGRNIYSHWPVIRIDVDIEKYVNIPSCDIDGFNDKLISLLPGLKKHKCSRNYEGGFVERLNRGTYMAHILEHVALEIQKTLGYDVNFGKTRYLENESVYSIVFSFIDETAGYESGLLAFDILQDILQFKEVNLPYELEKVKSIVQEKSLGISTRAIIDEATKRGIPSLRIGENSLIQLGYGKYARKIQATITDATNCIAVDTASDKELTKEILSFLNIPVPIGRAVETWEEAITVADEIGYPVVVKPFNGNQGKGVSIELRTPEEVERAFKIAKMHSNRILVEKFIHGKHYRVVVVDNKVVAVAQRISTHVIGNGVNTIEELIDLENKSLKRGYGHEKPLTKIVKDDVMMMVLEKKNRHLNDVPTEGEVVFLRENANLSTGGIAVDVTDDIHEENKRLIINAVRAIGLDIAGVDVTTADISRPIVSSGGTIIEINACPGIRMHHYPSIGKNRNVASTIVDMLFPKGAKHSVPIISITGTNGKTTTTRMLSNIIKKSGLIVGMTNTGGVYIDDELVVKGDTTGPQSARIVLMDKRVEVAVLETARGGIVNKGLGYNVADVGIITNIGDDHLGLDGINTLEEMANVKSLVVEAVNKNGYAVLNADDPYTEVILNNVKCNIVLFSQSQNNKLIEKHISLGRKAVYISDENIWVFDGEESHKVIEISRIPATFGGVLKHNIENSMAAVAGAYSLGVSIATIAEALSEFNTDIKYNPGRFNVFDVRNFKVIIDYGHNIDGYSKVLEGLKRMKQGNLIGIIGVPGDRTDINILKIGEISGKYFDYVHIKEDMDLRGRKPEEVAKILKKGCSLGGLTEDRMEIECNEVNALRKAIENGKEGDLIVVFYENYQPLVDLINSMAIEKTTLEQEVVDDESKIIAAKA